MEKEKKEQEEYEQWKREMAVEKEGTVAAEKEQLEKRKEEIISILQRHKVVVVEDLAAEFEIKTADMIELIQSLDKQGRISGVIDDRGKFIYVSREELKKIAAYITRKGRVSIEDIARESNKLINLNSQA